MSDDAAPPVAPARSSLRGNLPLIAGGIVVTLLVAAAVVIVAVRLGGGTPSGSPTVASPPSHISGTEPGTRTGTATMWELRAGDCLDRVGSGVNLFAVTLVDCDEFHAAEVWIEVPVPEDWGGPAPASPAEATAWLRPECLKAGNRVLAVRDDLLDANPDLIAGAFGWSPSRFASDGLAGLCVIFADNDRQLNDYLYPAAQAILEPVDDAEVWGIAHSSDVLDLVGGDCLADAIDDWTAVDLTHIEVVPCNEPHHAEVWMRFTAPDDWQLSAPDDDTVGRYVVDQCLALVQITLTGEPDILDDYPRFAYRPLPWTAAYAARSEQGGLCVVSSTTPIEHRYLYHVMLLAVDQWAEDRKPREAP